MAGTLAEKGLVILDRDGVINRDSINFIKSADEWIPLPGSIAAIELLYRVQYTVVIATNQSGLARGLFDRNGLRTIHRKLRKRVAAAGGRVDRIVVCPHGPDDGCSCRKPEPGLLHRLAGYYGVDLAGVPVIGDSLRDIQAASRVGARPILVRTGNGEATESELAGELRSIEVFDNLATAAWQLAKE